MNINDIKNLGDIVVDLLVKNYGDKNFHISDTTFDPIDFKQCVIIRRNGKYFKLDLENVSDELLFEKFDILKDYDISKHIEEIVYSDRKDWIRNLFHSFGYDVKKPKIYTKEEIERMGFEYHEMPMIIQDGTVWIARTRRFDSLVEFYDFMDKHYTKKICGMSMFGLYQLMARIFYTKEDCDELEIDVSKVLKNRVEDEIKKEEKTNSTV